MALAQRRQRKVFNIFLIFLGYEGISLDTNTNSSEGSRPKEAASSSSSKKKTGGGPKSKRRRTPKPTPRSSWYTREDDGLESARLRLLSDGQNQNDD